MVLNDSPEKEIFDYLEEKGIEAGIKVRKNSSTRSSGSPSHKKAVLELKELGYDRWKEREERLWL